MTAGMSRFRHFKPACWNISPTLTYGLKGPAKKPLPENKKRGRKRPNTAKMRQRPSRAKKKFLQNYSMTEGWKTASSWRTPALGRRKAITGESLFLTPLSFLRPEAPGLLRRIPQERSRPGLPKKGCQK